MPNADKFGFEDEDNSYQVQETELGISGVSGIAKRGPIGDTGTLVVSESDFLKIYGPETPGNDFAKLCLRHLRKGGQLRVNRIVHYTDVTDPTTATATKPAVKTIKSNATPQEDLLQVASKYPGADYNKLKIQTTNPSNGATNAFDLLVWIDGEKDRTLETYKGLIINDLTLNDPDNDVKLLAKVNNSSKLVIVSKAPGYPVAPVSIKPFMQEQTFSGATDGGTVMPTDYIGDATAGTGFFAFDGYDDMMQIAVPVIYDTDVNNAGAQYAEDRQDLMFFAHINPELDFNDMIAARALVTAATKYTAFFSGNVKLSSNPDVFISEIGDILTIANRVDSKFGPWWSMANFNRGIINDALGVQVNFGGKGNYLKLNALANRQINMVINKNGKTYLNGNFTGQVEESKASYLNIVRLLIYIKKSLGPTIEKYLEEPIDIPTFIKLANEVEPFLERIRTGRGLYAYKWDGDQNVGNINDVKINNLADIDLGIYRVKLALEPINGIGEIIVGISLNKTGTISMDILDDTTGTF